MLRIRPTAGAEDGLQFEPRDSGHGFDARDSSGLEIGDPRVMDSTGALDLPDIPNSLLVVVGGYIGLELSSVYAARGSAVTVRRRHPAASRRPFESSRLS